MELRLFWHIKKMILNNCDINEIIAFMSTRVPIDLFLAVVALASARGEECIVFKEE